MHDSIPDLSVLVPTHGRSATLAQLLASLSAQTLEPQRFEVIVVDDGSPEPVVLETARYPFRLVLLRQAQAGPGAARNRGLEHCRAPLVLILNDDAVCANDLCERHLAAHAELPERRAVLGTFHFTARALQSPFVRVLDQSDLLFTFTALQDRREYDWRFFWTCNLSLPVAGLREVGGFDAERFPEAIVEDVELGFRLHKRGWRVVYREDCRATHDHALTPSSYLQRGVRLGRYLLRMWQKHGDPRIVWCRSQAEACMALDLAVTGVEFYRTTFAGLERALARLEEEYRGRELPPELVQQTIKLLQEVGFGAFRRGMHLEHTGVDGLEVMERGAPSGGLTSVVVVSYDALANTRRCIEALRAARDERHPIEIVVVDNGSRDGSAEWLAAQSDLVLVKNDHNAGAPRARNQALKLCRGAWVAFLDNDVFVPRGWLARALYHGAVDPRVGSIALVANRASKNQVVPYTGGSDPESIERFADARGREFHRRGQDCALFTSLAVLVKREVIERIGGFDERFSPWGFEDDDLAVRVRLAGWRNRVALDTFVFHAAYDNAKKQARHDALLQENWRKFAEKWGPPGRVPPLFDYNALELGSARNQTQELHVPLESSATRPPRAPALPVEPLAPVAARHNLIVLGSGRSGTSLLAGMLSEAGWFVGDDPYPGRPANPKGFFETAEINGINEYLIAAETRLHPRLGAMQRWLAVLERPLAGKPPAELEARMRALAARAPFAFKDPRFCYTLPAWRAALGPVRHVCVFREPGATIESVLRECAEADYLRGVPMDFARAEDLWCAMYRAVLAQVEDPSEWLFVHFDQLLTNEGRERLEAYAGAPLPRDFPDARLSRARGGQAVRPESAELYAELCRRAQHMVRPLAIATPPPAALSAARPELSVLVCTYQRLATLRRCLASFERQSADGRYEIVVVDDGSTDGTREWLDTWKPAVSAKVVHRANGGLAAARNTGLELATGEIVLLVNDDTLADPRLVETHLDAHRAARAAGERCPAVLGTFEQPPAALDNALMRVLEDDHLVFCFSQLEPGAWHDWNAFWTCNVSVGLAHVRAVGGFDETFRHYGCEDTDLAFRLHEQRGMRVLYEPRARAGHEHVLDFEALVRRNRTVARAWTRMFQKHPRTLQHPTWREHAQRTRASMEHELVQALPERAELERSARELARIDVGALERARGANARKLAIGIVKTLREQLKALNRLWWFEGELEGLRSFGVDSIAALTGTRVSGPQQDAPWPLASQAPERFLAWPRYDRPDDLEGLLTHWSAALLDHPERCLCLRHDPHEDGDLSMALERLQDVYSRVIGSERELEVLVIDEPIPERDLPRLGRAVRGILRVPGRSDPLRDGWNEKVGAELLADPAGLLQA
jgi:GT2 family glycosyltransferase